MAAPSRAWSVFKQIFAEHWDAVQHAQPRSQPADDGGLVTKRLGGGNPDQMGDIAYRGVPCGEGKHRVAMSCQSSLGLRCAKVYVDNGVSQVSQVLHEGVSDRPSILTVPAMFRGTVSQNAAVVLSAFMRCGAPCLEDGSRTVRGKALRGGSITVRHTQGRHGPYHPPLHLSAPSGGADGPGERWEHLTYWPDELLRRQWQWPLLTMLRQTLQTATVNQWVDGGCQPYPNGHKGPVPSQSQSVARYVAQDVVRPPISVRRIDRYEGAQVTSHDRSHRTDQGERDTVAVETCIGRMLPHTMPKGLKRLRSDGMSATRTFAKGQVALQTALAKGEGGVKGAVHIIARLTSRQREEHSTGRDPLIWPHCRSARGVWRIWHPTYGVIYDEGEVSKRGT